MDFYFYYDSVTDISSYNCSAVSSEELNRLKAIKHPVRGVTSFIVGFPMLFVYIACLRVMVNLKLVRKTCYKIMFVLGLYEMATVLMNDVIISYILFSGMAFCDAPNTFYVIGIMEVALWAGASYFCLYLAFNRIMESLQLRRRTIALFFTPIRTTIGILIGFIYTCSFMLFTSPAIFSNEFMTTVPNPLGFEMSPRFKMRHYLMIADNTAVVVLTAILYGIFCVIVRKKFSRLGIRNTQNRLQHQIFIQSTLLSGFNFLISMFYTVFLFLGESVIFPQISFFVYQYTSGLQALIYLFFNQTILDGVRADMLRLFGTKKEVGIKIKTNETRNNPTRSNPAKTLSTRTYEPKLITIASIC